MAVAVIVCGGRGFNDRAKIFETLDHIYERRGISVVIHGGCSGVDKIAGEWAKAMGVRAVRCLADWSQGKAAGPIRNRFMLTLKPDGVIAFPGGTGTADMKAQAVKAGVPVMEIQP